MTRKVFFFEILLIAAALVAYRCLFIPISRHRSRYIGIFILSPTITDPGGCYFSSAQASWRSDADDLGASLALA